MGEMSDGADDSSTDVLKECTGATRQRQGGPGRRLQAAQTIRLGCRWQSEVAWVPCSQPDAGCQRSTRDSAAACPGNQLKQHSAGSEGRQNSMLLCCLQPIWAVKGTDRLQQVEVLLQFQQPAMAAAQTGIKYSQQQLNQAITGHMHLQDKVADFLMVAGALLAGHPPGRWTTVLAEIFRPKSATTYRYDASSALRTGAAMSVWKISGNKVLKSPVDCWMSRAEFRDWFQEPERVGWLAIHQIFSTAAPFRAMLCRLKLKFMRSQCFRLCLLQHLLLAVTSSWAGFKQMLLLHSSKLTGRLAQPGLYAGRQPAWSTYSSQEACPHVDALGGPSSASITHVSRSSTVPCPSPRKQTHTMLMLLTDLHTNLVPN